MARCYSLAYLTAPDVPPPEFVNLAADLGYRSVGLRILPASENGVCWPLIENKALLRETVTRRDVTEIGVLDVEIVWLTPHFDIATLVPFFDVCGQLGARAVLVGGADPDVSRMTGSFASLCDAALAYNMTVDLEYMPWTPVPDLSTAVRIVDNAKAANGGVLIDAIHFMRAGTRPSDVAAVPRARLHLAQICDASAVMPATTDGLISAARQRSLPGEGDIPLRDLFAALPSDIAVSVEVPNARAIDGMGSRAWARRALEASRRVLQDAAT